MKYYSFLFILLQIAMLPSAFAQKQNIVFVTQWTAQSQFAGYYVAFEKGFYENAGLDVTIVHPSASSPALSRLLMGTANVVGLQFTQAMEWIDQGIPLVNILQTSQRNSLMIIPRWNDMTTVNDLKGKKVGIWKAGFGELAEMMNSELQLDIEWVTFVNNVNLFVSGSIDATLAMSYNEYLRILACGITPERCFVLPIRTMICRRTDYTSQRAILNKTANSWRLLPRLRSKAGIWAKEHPEETMDIVMSYVKRNNVATNRVHQKLMLEEILRLQCESDSTEASFRLSPEKVKAASDLLLKHNRISKEVTYQKISEGL